MKNTLTKSFPADLSVKAYNNVLEKEVDTFLADKNCSSVLYAYLLTKSRGVDRRTMVLKKDLPPITKIAEELKISRPTYYKRMKSLQELGYIKEVEYNGEEYYELSKEVEKYYFELPQKTIDSLCLVMRKESLKTFIYIGRKFESPNYSNTFTLVELGEHTGYKKRKSTGKLQAEAYEDLWYNLYFFQCTGLIDVEQKYDEKGLPYFVIHSVTKDLEKANKVVREWVRQSPEEVEELARRVGAAAA